MTTTRSSVAAAVAAALYASAATAEGAGATPDPGILTRVADASTSADSGADSGVSEVIVTATRREASAQADDEDAIFGT